jgi:AcrR family transcriptional regulator
MEQTSLPFILETTQQIIAQKGCRATTLQDIIVKTGLSKGAIYHYVKSKDELFALVMKENVKKINTAFETSVKNAVSGDLTHPTQTIVQTFFDNESNNQIFIYLLSQRENETIISFLETIHRASLEMAKQWIKVGQEHHAIPQSLPYEKMANLLITLFYGLRVQRTILSKEECDRLSNEIMELVIHILGK